ncbi:hypothetical protein SPI_07510 [Niveomyces insectorum RCEF 264]|uniref:Uncharacterized protein n=1 Tax=Niveomyces insectorum RCEF 264 TaxID=1081102 RepID=A0A167PXW9_9HYPO|nr:hypothetical protein SPI_07510 [Niveomyces insectorum RCEF 264]
MYPGVSGQCAIITGANSGLVEAARQLLRLGHEATKQANHYGIGLLAVLLPPVLKSKAGPPFSGGSSSSKTTTARITRAPVLTAVSSVTSHLAAFPNRSQRPLLKSFDDEALLTFSSQRAPRRIEVDGPAIPGTAGRPRPARERGSHYPHG